MGTKLKENIDWVGYVDWTVRDFHGYHTNRGSSYNAYLVRDEKTALIDTVKAPYACTLLERVSALKPLDQIDYVICNHAEPDHSGAMPEVLKLLPNAKVVCNAKCKDTLEKHYNTSKWNFHIVKDGDTLSLGKRTLTFINTPMAHWPESMFTYVPEDKLLFSMDGFGQHYASSGRFDDEVPLDVVMEESRTYYANILTPYGKQVGAVLKKAAGIEIEMIAPSHGIIWRKHIPTIIQAYKDWTVCKPKCKVLVVYDSMWNTTEVMANAILDGAMRDGVEAVLHNIRKSNITILATEVLDAAAIAFGSPTLNRTMLPTMGALLIYLKGLRPTGKTGLAFGSYGWAKGGAVDVNTMLEEMKFDIQQEPIQTQYGATAEVLEECRKAGAALADKAQELTKKQ